MHHILTFHPAAPPAQPLAIVVDADVGRGDSGIVFAVSGGTLQLPRPAAPVRTDSLWQRTCFELFVHPEGSAAYFEFNFSPSTAWAAYCFDDYREGMADLPLPPPRIEPTGQGVRVAIDLSGLPALPWRIGLSAVIEEPDGTKSYWALAHPSGPPDFHHHDCFALRLPAPPRP